MMGWKTPSLRRRRSTKTRTLWRLVATKTTHLMRGSTIISSNSTRGKAQEMEMRGKMREKWREKRKTPEEGRGEDPDGEEPPSTPTSLRQGRYSTAGNTPGRKATIAPKLPPHDHLHKR